MSKKKGTNNKKNAKAQEKVQNLEQNEVVEKDINKPNETKTSDNESTKVSKEAKRIKKVAKELDTIISTKPEIKRISISVSNRLVDFEAPLNSFQMKRPHKAATIVAPCPSA